ncbi:hypothetical protein ACFOD4_04610 [Pseudoroseomonas globiformis]|uniref:Uncharacterized protein n=1 Tax=Teichococcus globiformis TaxID=2307229 RepID=A0ABV7FVD1_9PROT
MDVQPALTDFDGQISWVNGRRHAAGLPPLDREQAILEIIRCWNMMLGDAKARLQTKARRDLGRDLANNSFTHLVLALDIESSFRAAVEAMVWQSSDRACGDLR